MDYETDFLLDRAYKLLEEKKVKTKESQYEPPQAEVMKYGSKKTGVINFKTICKTLLRTENELMKYILGEFSCQGSITGQHELIINGKFNEKSVQSVLNKYIKKYVLCYVCKSSKTKLAKENRLTILECENCKSKTSVETS
jgi:putative translation initiation factor aIF-2 beta subunit